MAKQKAAKVPKRLAGIKLPKPVRRAARPLAGILADPMGRQVLAGLVVAGAIAVWRDERVRAAAARLGERAKAWAEGLSADLAQRPPSAAAPSAIDREDRVTH